MDMNFIDAMIEDIVSKKKTVDNIAFLNLLKEELDRKGIVLTVNCQKAPFLDDNIITSGIVGIELDLSEHDKQRDAEIEKYKKLYECVKQERYALKTDYSRRLEELESEINGLKESKSEIPYAPIKVADYLIDKYSEPRKDYMNMCAKCLGENGSMFDNNTYGEILQNELKLLREIAEHLLVYCNHMER